MDLQLKLYPQKDDFLWKYTGTDKYKMHFRDIFLRVTQIALDPDVRSTLEQNLAVAPAIYPYFQSGIKALNLSAGLCSFTFENVFTGDVPSTLILGMVDSSAFEGNTGQNPYYFKHNQLDSVGLQVDGQYVPGPPQRLNFDGAIVGNNVNMFLRTFDIFGKRINTGLSRAQFTRGATLLCFDLSSSDSGGDGTLPVHTRGNLKIAGTFSVPLAQNTTLVVYARFLKTIAVDKDRAVTV